MTNCYICKGQGILIWKEKKYSVYICKNCKVSFFYPLPDFPEEIYDKKYFENWYIPFYEERKKYFEKLFKKIEKFFSENGKIFDFGCGVGIFMDLMKEKGFEVLGYDVSLFASNFCRKRGFNILIDISKLNEMSNFFDVVSMFDVIGHMRDPIFFLEICKKILRPGGILIIKTPLHSKKLFKFANLFSFTGKSRILLHIPAQIYHFDKESIVNLGKITGFRIKEIFIVKEFVSYKVNLINLFKIFLREKSLIAVFEK